MSKDPEALQPEKPVQDAAQGRAKPAAKGRRGAPPPGEEAAASPAGEGSISDQKEWASIRQNWLQEQAGIAQARASAFFEADDELPLSKHLLLVSIFSFFILFIVWANFAELDEVTRGQGKIIPSSDVQALQSLDPGIIDEFLVKEGDAVKQGQVLVRLRNIEAASDLGANRARYLGLLAAITRLQAEAEGKDTVVFPDEVIKGSSNSVTEEMNAFKADKLQLQGQVNVLQQQLTQKGQEVDEINTKIGDLRGVISLLRQEMDMIKPLVERGSAPKLELLQRQRDMKEKTTELNGLMASLPRAKSAVEEAKARIEEAHKTARAQAQSALADKLTQMNEIRERLTALKERKTRKEIRSPVDGTIQEISVKTVGGVVRAGEDIIKIVPKDDQLIVEARVKPRDRAFIYPGQQAVIKVSAYDFSIYGGLKAELLDISADTIKDEKGQIFYRVRLRTFDKVLKHKGEDLPIIPGMVATVDILTGKKTVMEYLLKPIIKTLNNAMNER